MHGYAKMIEITKKTNNHTSVNCPKRSYKWSFNVSNSELKHPKIKGPIDFSPNL